MNRVTLVKTLANLSTSDFDMLVAAIDGAGGQVGRHGTVREKAADLLRWADSSKGCGIPVIEEALSIFH